MVFKQFGQDFIVRLDKDELLIDSILKFIKERGIRPSWVQGLGAALWAEVGFYNLADQKYSYKKIERGLEIASLTGNITWVNNQPSAHFHVVLSDENLQTYGGHLKEAAVAGTCELFLTTFNTAISRKRSPEGGLDILDI